MYPSEGWECIGGEGNLILTFSPCYPRKGHCEIDRSSATIRNPGGKCHRIVRTVSMRAYRRLALGDEPRYEKSNASLLTVSARGENATGYAARKDWCEEGLRHGRNHPHPERKERSMRRRVKAMKELLIVRESHNSHIEVQGVPSFFEGHDILGTEEPTLSHFRKALSQLFTLLTHPLLHSPSSSRYSLLTFSSPTYYNPLL